MSEIINTGLDQYGAGLFEQQQFGTAGVEGVKQGGAYKPIRDNRSVVESVGLR